MDKDEQVSNGDAEEPPTSLFRMVGWLPVGVVFYVLSVALGSDFPQWQTLCWKLGHACAFSWLGYWISRQALGRLMRITGIVNTMPEAMLIGCGIIGRAIIIGAALSVAHGL